mgnify:CR=1 FL=1
MELQIDGDKTKQLLSLAEAKKLRGGVFRTNSINFYHDACLWVAVDTGNPPKNRHSKLVLDYRDVSYSIGRPENGKNKWARALDWAIDFVTNYK